MSNLTNLTAMQLRQAAGLKDKIQALNKKLGRIVGSSEAKPLGRPPGTTKRRRKMSTAARAKIGAAQRLRWAKIHGVKSKAINRVPKFRPGKGLKYSVN